MDYIIGVDIGGTATDCAVMDEKGVLTVGKAFSTPPTFVEGVMNAAEIVAKKVGLELPTLLANTRLFLHSTTIAENAIATASLARAGLLVTRGCEDTLLMMRGAYGRWSGLTEEEIKNPLETDKPPALIPFSLIKGIKERTDIRGRVLVEPDEDEISRAIREQTDQGVEGVGVCFLCSFSNSHNENIAKRMIQTLHPELYSTLSSELSPTLGEYERTSTVALNVSLGPFVSGYLTDLKAALEKSRFHGALLIMQAYGGLLHTEEALTQPVGMIESGPVSGLVGTKFVGDILGFRNIVAADMGGTTFKVGVIREGLIDYQRTPMVLRYHYALPKMDIVSIGLAGGSIVSLNPYTGAPRIGPRSAGARPGPVCYGFGGTEPTITDIDLILGYLNSAFFLEGRATLDYGNTLQIFKSQIADPLAMEVREAAAEVYRLVNSFMYDLLHKVTVEKGLDPRDYVLFSYGGTAGMHLGAVAQELQVKQVIIPYAASVQGAFGLVSADVTHEYQTTRPMLLPVKVEIVNDMFQQLIDKTRRRLQAEGFADQNMLIRRSIDMRYRYQIHEMTTPLDGQDSMSQSNLAEACHTFAGLYEERYGKESGQSESDIEMVAFRVRGTGLIRRPELGVYQLAGPDPKAGYVETRKIYLCTEEFKGTVEAKGYNFEKLLPGNEIDGPAIIWSPITTILINPGHKARLDSYKNIVLTW